MTTNKARLSKDRLATIALSLYSPPQAPSSYVDLKPQA